MAKVLTGPKALRRWHGRRRDDAAAKKAAGTDGTDPGPAGRRNRHRHRRRRGGQGHHDRRPALHGGGRSTPICSKTPTPRCCRICCFRASIWPWISRASWPKSAWALWPAAWAGCASKAMASLTRADPEPDHWPSSGCRASDQRRPRAWLFTCCARRKISRASWPMRSARLKAPPSCARSVSTSPWPARPCARSAPTHAAMKRASAWSKNRWMCWCWNAPRAFRAATTCCTACSRPSKASFPDDLKIRPLIERVKQGGRARGHPGDQPQHGRRRHGALPAPAAAPFGPRVTRLARGLPVGGDLEYADQNTLLRALAGRQEMG